MRKKDCILASFFLFILTIPVVLPQSAYAVPAFARQTGMACSTCHFQHFPALNAFGRAFKAGGYTMIGGQSMIEGDMLSMPSVLNASLVLKVRYQKTNGDDDGAGTNKGELQFPDEAALFLGGRVGEHLGFAYEMGLNGEGADNFTSFKIPIVHDVGGTKVSLIPFNTDALGASFGFELLNTGAVRNVRTIEHRRDISAQQYIGTDGPAEGIAFVAVNNRGFINYSLWAPSHTATDIGPISHYVRVAATPVYAGWDLGGGIQWWGGTTKIGSDVVDTGGFDEDHPDKQYQTHAWAIDAQAQGAFRSMPLGVYAAYGSADKSETGEPENFFNSNSGEKTAFSIIAELGVQPGKTTVALGYRSGDTGAASSSEQTAIALGATYHLIQNVQLQLNHSFYGGDYYDLAANNEDADGDQLTTLMLFAAF